MVSFARSPVGLNVALSPFPATVTTPATGLVRSSSILNVVPLTVDEVTFSENVATISAPTATPVALLKGDIVPTIGPVVSGTGVDVGIGVGEATGSPLINKACLPATASNTSSTWMVECSSLTQRYTAARLGLVINGSFKSFSSGWLKIFKTQVSLDSLCATREPWDRSISKLLVPGVSVVAGEISRLWVSVGPGSLVMPSAWSAPFTVSTTLPLDSLTAVA